MSKVRQGAGDVRWVGSGHNGVIRTALGSVFLGLTFLVCGSQAPLAAQLPKKVVRQLDSLLEAAPFEHSLWGIALVDEKGRLLYGRNADKLFIPASNTKLRGQRGRLGLLPPDWTVAHFPLRQRAGRGWRAAGRPGALWSRRSRPWDGAAMPPTRHRRASAITTRSPGFGRSRPVSRRAGFGDPWGPDW